MIDRPGNALEHLDGALHYVKELVGSGEDLDGDVFLKNFNYRFMMVYDITATPIVRKKEPGSAVSCTVGGEGNIKVCLLYILHKIKCNIFSYDTDSY